MLSRPDYGISGVSVAVRAGSFQDTYPGIAHMLEHALFLASKKYNAENDIFVRCIQKYSGSFNAYTAYAETVYFF
jgi:insulysin